MARVKYGAIVTSIRGSVGGSTFQKNAFGDTLKNKSIQVRPNTQLQQIQKTIFAKAVKSWRNFSDAQRSAWNTFATNFPQSTKSDSDVFITGFNAFVKWQSARWIGNNISTAPDTAPVISLPDVDVVSVTLTLSAGVLTIGMTWTADTGAWLVNWFLSKPRLDSQLFVGSLRRFFFMTNSETDTENITARYIELFGQLPFDGDIVNVGYVLYTDGGGVVYDAINIRVTVA